MKGWKASTELKTVKDIKKLLQVMGVDCDVYYSPNIIWFLDYGTSNMKLRIYKKLRHIF